jgi:hypothetical protein
LTLVTWCNTWQWKTHVPGLSASDLHLSGMLKRRFGHENPRRPDLALRGEGQ